MKKIFLYLFVFVSVFASAKNDTDILKQVYEYRSDNRNETVEQAERNAKRKAKIQALEDKYGVDVSSINTVVSKTTTTDTVARSQTDMFRFDETSLRGEWLETLSEEVLSREFTDGFWYIKVQVKGKTRLRPTDEIQIVADLLNDANDTRTRDVFRNGDHLYIRFLAPVAGNLLIYGVGEDDTAYRLLPYSTTQTGCYPVIANNEYMLFSLRDDKEAEEMMLGTDKGEETNLIYIIFTPNPIVMAADKKGKNKKAGEEMPNELPFKDFKKWLDKQRVKDPSLVVKMKEIRITHSLTL